MPVVPGTSVLASGSFGALEAVPEPAAGYTTESVTVHGEDETFSISIPTKRRLAGNAEDAVLERYATDDGIGMSPWQDAVQLASSSDVFEGGMQHEWQHGR